MIRSIVDYGGVDWLLFLSLSGYRYLGNGGTSAETKD